MIYEAIMGLSFNRLSEHQVTGCLQEFMLGNMTGAQVTAALGLDAEGEAEMLALRDRVLAETDPSPKVQGIQRRLFVAEIDRLLSLAAVRWPPFDTVAAVKARIGV